MTEVGFLGGGGRASQRPHVGHFFFTTEEYGGCLVTVPRKDRLDSNGRSRCPDKDLGWQRAHSY